MRNPAISSTYRRSMLPKPNQTVLEAQARICTGPTQTRPLSEEQAFKVLDTILDSFSYGTYFVHALHVFPLVFFSLFFHALSFEGIIIIFSFIYHSMVKFDSFSNMIFELFFSLI
uniref:Uncharacterized protein n=1 Tax=Gossypium raimondii TaxID=29730 RepID=A0A0D2S4K2_GOSRA|nr:hypothetical protein B456_012G172500 [Gossypium raimondii]